MNVCVLNDVTDTLLRAAALAYALDYMPDAYAFAVAAADVARNGAVYVLLVLRVKLVECHYAALPICIVSTSGSILWSHSSRDDGTPKGCNSLRLNLA